MSTIFKSTHLLLFPLVLLLLSSVNTVSASPFFSGDGDVPKFEFSVNDGTSWNEVVSTGDKNYDSVKIYSENNITYWVFYKCDPTTGKMKKVGRVAKQPRDPGVSDGEAEVLDKTVEDKVTLKVTIEVTLASGGNPAQQEVTGVSPNHFSPTEPCVKATVN